MMEIVKRQKSIKHKCGCQEEYDLKADTMGTLIMLMSTLRNQPCSGCQLEEAEKAHAKRNT